MPKTSNSHDTVDVLDCFKGGRKGIQDRFIEFIRNHFQNMQESAIKATAKEYKLNCRIIEGALSDDRTEQEKAARAITQDTIEQFNNLLRVPIDAIYVFENKIDEKFWLEEMAKSNFKLFAKTGGIHQSMHDKQKLKFYLLTKAAREF